MNELEIGLLVSCAILMVATNIYQFTRFFIFRIYSEVNRFYTLFNNVILNSLVYWVIDSKIYFKYVINRRMFYHAWKLLPMVVYDFITIGILSDNFNRVGIAFKIIFLTMIGSEFLIFFIISIFIKRREIRLLPGELKGSIVMRSAPIN